MKLHLGCGKRYLKGFFHIDIEKFPHVDLVSSIDDLSAIPDKSCELIYSSHAFEYFDRFKALEVLREWGRVLNPGGQLWLAVPDFEQLITVYTSTSNLDNILGPLFGRWPTSNGSRGQDTFIYHKTVWDKSTLTSVLENAGFIDVEDFDPIAFLASIDKEFDDHSLAFFPHMDRSGIQVSLCLRALKP